MPMASLLGGGGGMSRCGGDFGPTNGLPIYILLAGGLGTTYSLLLIAQGVPPLSRHMRALPFHMLTICDSDPASLPQRCPRQPPRTPIPVWPQAPGALPGASTHREPSTGPTGSRAGGPRVEVSHIMASIQGGGALAAVPGTGGASTGPVPGIAASAAAATGRGRASIGLGSQGDPRPPLPAPVTSGRWGLSE
jgi:hypothetical protein